MDELSEMGKILVVGHELLGSDRTADYLGRRVGVSRATLMRYLGELRHLGCKIVSRRESGTPTYRLENPDEVVLRMSRWLDLERKRTLLDS